MLLGRREGCRGGCILEGKIDLWYLRDAARVEQRGCPGGAGGELRGGRDRVALGLKGGWIDPIQQGYHW